MEPRKENIKRLISQAVVGNDIVSYGSIETTIQLRSNDVDARTSGVADIQIGPQFPAACGRVSGHQRCAVADFAGGRGEWEAKRGNR